MLTSVLVIQHYIENCSSRTKHGRQNLLPGFIEVACSRLSVSGEGTIDAGGATSGVWSLYQTPLVARPALLSDSSPLTENMEQAI